MSFFGDALSFAEHVGGSMVNGAEHLAEDGYKLATDGHYREQAWKSALSDVKAAASFGEAAFRSVDTAKDQIGSMIDSGEQYLENKVDDGRAWLRQHGGVVGQALSDQIGFGEGVAESLYGAGKGLVQLADGASSLANPIEWATNPGANMGRIKSALNTAESLGKIASLADPTSWITDPKGNEQLAGALWNSATTSFKNDPAKFLGNVVGTVGTLAIPGAEGAGLVGDAGKVTELARGAAVTGDIGKAAAITGDAGKAAAITGDAGKAAALSGDAGKGTAIAGDAGKVEGFPDGLAYRKDLPGHLAGPEGFTKSGQLHGAHNLDNATNLLKSKGATYSLEPTNTPGISELKYKYKNPETGKTVSGRKTVYDPKIISDQTILDDALKAGQRGWEKYLQNPANRVFDLSEGGINFRVYINTDSRGNAFVGNVHPIP